MEPNSFPACYSFHYWQSKQLPLKIKQSTITTKNANKVVKMAISSSLHNSTGSTKQGYSPRIYLNYFK